MWSPASTGVRCADLFRNSVYTLVPRKSAPYQILLVESTKRRGMWHLPGGGMDLTEQSLDALRREFGQEAGRRLIVSRPPVMVMWGESNFYDNDGRFVHSIYWVFEGESATDEQQEHINGDPMDPNEIARCEWVDIIHLNECNTHPMFWPLIKQRIDFRNGQY